MVLLHMAHDCHSKARFGWEFVLLAAEPLQIAEIIVVHFCKFAEFHSARNVDQSDHVMYILTFWNDVGISRSYVCDIHVVLVRG